MCASAPTNSNYYSYQRFEPCSVTSSGHAHVGGNGNGPVERIDTELPDYYVQNTTVLQDDPRDFDDKVSRMFAQLNTGEVVGLVASFMMCIIFSFIVWSQLVKCYRRRILIATSLSKVRSSVGSLSGLLPSASRASLENLGRDDGDDGTDSPFPHSRRPRDRGDRSNKDKMVATLLVQMRTMAEQEEQQRRLELGGLTTSASGDDSVSNVGTIVDLSSSSSGEEGVYVNRSDLPPLPDGGRVLAVIGARIIEDEQAENADARSSATSETHTADSFVSSHPGTEMTEFTSPLYQDANDGSRNGAGGGMLRLRRHLD